MIFDNHIISRRQIIRMFIVDSFGISSLILPGLLAKVGGVYGGISIILGCLLALAMIPIIYSQGMYNVKKYISPIILIGLALAGIIVLRSASNVIKDTLLPDTKIAVIGILLVLTSLYAVIKGVEGRARICEMVFWYIVVHIVVMLLFSLSDFDYKSVFYNGTFDIGGILKGALFVFILIFGIMFLNVPLMNTIDKKEIRIAVTKGTVFVGLMILIFYEILQGVFTNEIIRHKKWPIISLMTVINVPGKVLSRVDAIMSVLWIISLFSLLAMIIYSASEIAADLFGDKSFPITKVVFSGVIFLMACFMTGCGSVELENKIFPMAVGFEIEDDEMVVVYSLPNLGTFTDQKKGDSGGMYEIKAKSLDDSVKSFEMSSDKTVDFSHLKCIVFHKDFTDSSYYEELIKHFEKEEIFADNIHVLFTQDEVSKILDDENEKGGSVGNWLFKAISNYNKINDVKCARIGSLIRRLYDIRDTSVILWVNYNDNLNKLEISGNKYI